MLECFSLVKVNQQLLTDQCHLQNGDFCFILQLQLWRYIFQVIHFRIARI